MAGNADDKAIEAKAIVLDDGTELKGLTDADRWLAEATKKAADIASRYQPHEIVNDDDYARSKADRTEARKAIKAIDEERKGMTSAIEKALKEFRAGAKTALAPLSDIDGQYKKRLDDYDDARLAKRLASARETYESEFADLAMEIPFDKLDATVGSKEKWHTLSISDKKLLDSVRGWGSRCVAELDTISQLPYDDDIVAGARVDYLSSLDLNKTVASARERWDAKERMRIERERREREAAAQAAKQSETAAQSVASQVVDTSAPAVSQAPNPFLRQDDTGQPASAPQAYVDAPMGIPAMIPDYDAPETHRYRIETDPMTDEQLETLKGMLQHVVDDMGVGVTLVVIG